MVEKEREMEGDLGIFTLEEMADSSTKLHSFVLCEFEDGCLAGTGFEIFLDDDVHRVEGVEHFDR